MYHPGEGWSVLSVIASGSTGSLPSGRKYLSPAPDGRQGGQLGVQGQQRSGTGQWLIKTGENNLKSGGVSAIQQELLRLSPTELSGFGWALSPSALISAGKLLLGTGGEGISTLTGKVKE